MTAISPEKQTINEVIPIVGLDCEDCAKTLASGLRKVTGVSDAQVSAAAGSARISFEPERIDRAELVKQIEAHGYRAGFSAGSSDELLFDLLGLDCADCARSVEAAVSQMSGIKSATVNFGSSTLKVTPREVGSAGLSAQISRVVDQAGYEARPRVAGSMPRLAQPKYWNDRRFLLIVAGFVAWMIGFGIAHFTSRTLLADAFFLTSLGLSGSRFARASWLSLKSRRIDMNVLMTVSAIGAAALGDWSEAAFIIVLFALGGTLQAVTLDRTRSAVRALMDVVPPDARLVRGGEEQIVPASSLVTGDLVRVRPGDRVPTDGEIVEGSSSLDQQAITGESMPVDRTAGDELYGGSVNGSGSLLVRVLKPANESTVARIIDLVASAQASKAPSEQFVDRFAAIYTPIVIALAGLIALAGAIFSRRRRNLGLPGTRLAGDRLSMRAGNFDAGVDCFGDRRGDAPGHSGQRRRAARNAGEGHHGHLRQNRHLDSWPSGGERDSAAGRAFGSGAAGDRSRRRCAFRTSGRASGG